MKKLMVLGASILQVPAILKAKEMGLQVIAVDMNKNAVGFRNADVCLEISTIDTPKVVIAAKDYNIDGILTLATDMPIRTVAAVAKELNIPGVNERTALKATNKGFMRECLKEHNVPIPNFIKVNKYDEYLEGILQFNGKFIVKPSDNSGSRGVYLVNDASKVENVLYAYEYSMKNSRNGKIVVEEFMEGPEVSVETLSISGEVNIIAITDKLTTSAPRFVEMGHSQPSCLPEIIIEKIESVTVDAVKAIGITDGPSHTELIVTDEGPKIVELGARLGGDNITTHLVPYSTGIDMVKCTIDIALGQKPDMKRKLSMGSAIRYFQSPVGQITDIKGLEKSSQIPGVKQICFVKNIGDYAGEIYSSLDRIGYVIAQGKDAAEAIRICETAIQNIEISVKELEKIN